MRNIVSISVAPFQRVSEEEISDRLTHGIPVGISARLSGLASIAVVTVGDADPAQLGVNRILHGSVEVSEDRVRVSVRLMDPANETIVWGPRVFERSMAEVFRLEAQITGEVVSTLGLVLAQGESRRLAKQPTRDALAYGLYLKAIHQLHVLAPPQASDQAAASLLEAIERDPKFALAYAGLSVLYMSMGDTDDAEVFAQNALALDADQAEAHWAMGWLHEERGDWIEAQASYEAGVRLSPSSSTLLSRHARLLSWLGGFDRAVELMERALLVDPTSWVRHMYAANIHRMARNF
ncbi:MAG: tetratricopeptide repeat protein, partial [Pseudomonadales bacterium]